MTVTREFDEAQLIIKVDGDFDQRLVETFKQAYHATNKQPQNIIVDLKETQYIDSSALGILIDLKDYAEKIKATVYIRNMNDVVLEIFRVLNFHKLFKPEYDQQSYGVIWGYHPEL